MTATGTVSETGRTMSESHKDALALGRTQGRAVRRYLEALESRQPRRGRKVSADDLRLRIQKLDAELSGDTPPAQRLILTQEKHNLEARLDKMEVKDDFETIERDFIEVAREYADRKGIQRATFREVGVPASVLDNAGIK